jgi:hypothetical protein
MMKLRTVMVAAVLMMVVMAMAETPSHQSETLSIEGYTGQANVIQYQGRALVDVLDLARITDGSLRFEEGGITLTLSGAADGDTDKSSFSHPFMKAAIEAMASIRQLGGTLRVTVQSGSPVRNTMAGNTIVELQNRAADGVALASSAASTEADSRGIELLRNEFNSAQAWADRYVTARNSLSAANLTVSENPLKEDEEAEKIVRCGQFLAQMFASGTFQDDAACH